MDHFFTSWMQGYLTALNMRGVTIRPMANVETESWLMNYCQQQPQLNFEAAVTRLVEELKP